MCGVKGVLSRSVTGEGLRGDVSVLGRDLACNVSRAVHKSVNRSNASWEMSRNDVMSPMVSA